MSDTEATLVQAKTAKQQQLLVGVFGANVALNLITAGVATGFMRPSYGNPVSVWLHLVTAALFAIAIYVPWRSAKPRKQRAWAISFDDAGMQLAGNAGPPRAVPWRAIRSVNDTGAVMVLQYGIWHSVIIPRRAYTDDGAALWSLLQQQLIGSRSLHRRADARTIVNTASR